jgi:hypothetical protein
MATPNHATAQAATKAAILAVLHANSALIALCPAAAITAAWDLSTPDPAAHELIVTVTTSTPDNLPPTAPLLDAEVVIGLVTDHMSDTAGSAHAAILAAAVTALVSGIPSLAPTGHRLTSWTPPTAAPADSETTRRSTITFALGLHKT